MLIVIDEFAALKAEVQDDQVTDVGVVFNDQNTGHCPKCNGVRHRSNFCHSFLTPRTQPCHDNPVS